MKTFKVCGLTIHVFGGWGEIGGNQILLETDEASIFLDFGRPFRRWDRLFTGFLGPRTAYGLRDLLAFGLLPPLRGLYRDDGDDTLFPSELDRGLLKDGPPGDKVLAVLLSHAHLDHAGGLPYLRKDIRIVTSAATSAIVKAVQDTGQGGLEREVAYLSPRQVGDNGVLKTTGNSYILRNFCLLGERVPKIYTVSPAKTKTMQGPDWKLSQSPLHLGPFQVEAFPVDHSVPGALAFSVETPEGYVVYTGDLRNHGLQGKKTEEFLHSMERRDVLLLVVEGTHLGKERRTYTEVEVRSNLHDAVEKHRGVPIAIDFSPKNLDRLQSCYEVAKDLDRRLVLTPKDAYLLFALSDVEPCWEELLRNVVVLQEPKASGESGWETRLAEVPYIQRITLNEIAQDPGAFLLAFGFYELNRLLDLRLLLGSQPEGLYIFSQSYIGDEEQMLDLKALLNWLSSLNFRLLPEELAKLPDDPSRLDNPFHASGHASEDVLVQVVKRIEPSALLPVHTEVPERWRQLLPGMHILLE